MSILSRNPFYLPTWFFSPFSLSMYVRDLILTLPPHGVQFGIGLPPSSITSPAHAF